MVASELIEQLEAVINHRTATTGGRPTELTIGRPEWETLGRPDILAGVRIRPHHAPVTDLPSPQGKCAARG